MPQTQQQQQQCCCGGGGGFVLKIQTNAVFVGIFYNFFSCLFFIYSLYSFYHHPTCKTRSSSNVDCIQTYYTQGVSCVLYFLDYCNSLFLMISLMIYKPRFLLLFLIFNGSCLCFLTLFSLSLSILFFLMGLYVHGICFIFYFGLIMYRWYHVYSKIFI